LIQRSGWWFSVRPEAVVLGAGIQPEVEPVYPETSAAQPQPHDIQVTKPFPMLKDMELANLTGVQNFDV